MTARSSRRSFVTALGLSGLGVSWAGVLAIDRALVRDVAAAQCVPIPLAVEIDRSRYVIEVEVERFDAHAAHVRVLASWRGSPPRSLTISFSGRSHPLRRGGPEAVHLVFAQGASDARLMIYPCGASGLLEASMTDALRAAGLTRREIR